MTEQLLKNESRNSKLYNLKLTKETLRESLLEGGVTKKTDFEDFIGMNFNVNGISISAQTILRNFGSKTRSAKNLKKLYKELGIESNYFARESADFSDPKTIKKIFDDSGIDVSNMKFMHFLHTEFSSDIFEGNGKYLLT